MKTKYAETLAKEYDFESETDYYDYIIESVSNGQRTQAKSLFKKMKNYDRERFLVDYLDERIGIQKSTKNIMIGTLINS